MAVWSRVRRWAFGYQKRDAHSPTAAVPVTRAAGKVDSYGPGPGQRDGVAAAKNDPVPTPDPIPKADPIGGAGPQPHPIPWVFASRTTPAAPRRPAIVPQAYDPVAEAEDDLVDALVDELVARADDGFSFDPAWDDPWDWARKEIADVTIGYGPDIANRVEAEALDQMVDAAQWRVDEPGDDE